MSPPRSPARASAPVPASGSASGPACDPTSGATAQPLAALPTPTALIDQPRMQCNIERMQRRMNELGVCLRPHVKTSKCVQVTRAQLAAGARGITVSTLKEAERFFAEGITDILYAVGVAAGKLPQVLALRRRGCDLKIITDNVETARQIAAFGRDCREVFEVLIEIDTDQHRSGIPPEGADLLAVGRVLHDGGMRLAGVMTHAGSSYECRSRTALEAVAEQERAGCVRAADRLRAAGLPCPTVSVGSTPTALSVRSLHGVTEMRAGVYVFFDLVMHNVGVCTLDELALSVLTTVIGHQRDKGWAIVDAGWMAMSRDRGTQSQSHDFGYGQVCKVDGTPIDGYLVSGANQEHGIVSRSGAPDPDIERTFPVGTLLRILPNHACATGAQHTEYRVLTDTGATADWPRFSGW
jgi:D-serine deaminase-like pyridoxal phosphate-dependent protein